ncbi:unnamed protein product [Prunus armeniaca]|uniref:Autophagy-related protein n=1 Tax=Prunus armeniaca TaxID=36596 RepID=A0A6J5UJX9_PRUAR|nr:unnamed protein product [Prunus armeniaca]
MQAEEKNAAEMLPMIVENPPASNAFHDTEEKKFVADIPVSNSSEKTSKKTWNTITMPIRVLDPWNMRDYDNDKLGIPRSDSPGTVIRKNPMRRYKYNTCIEAGQLRKKCPNHIPVTVEKDTRSDIPDIDTKKKTGKKKKGNMYRNPNTLDEVLGVVLLIMYVRSEYRKGTVLMIAKTKCKYQFHVDTPLGEFVYAIRLIIGLSKKKPIFVFFKNTEPPACALMSAIDEENKDEDGFLHMTYSGEEKNVNESSRSGSFELVGSCSKLDNQLERTQAEENNPDLIPMIVENTAASSDIPGIEEQKNSSEKKRKKAWPVTLLDPWNRRKFPMAEIERPEFFGMSKRMTRDFVKRFKDRTCLEAGELREKRPNYVPVTVEKDARSDIPDIDMKKLASSSLLIELSIKKPIFVFFKNIEPPTGALMGAIDEENKDEDGFLHITYSGEERLCGSNGGQECP